MGRKSALSPEQWAEVERRHLIDGESINSLAKEFGVNEGTIRKKINPNKSEQEKSEKPLRVLAQEKIEAERKIRDISEVVSTLPMVRQSTFNDLVRSLQEISGHAASAGAYGMATAHRLAGIAHMKAAEIDDAAPLTEESVQALKGIAVLSRMANEASEIGMNLLRANKDVAAEAGREDVPTSLDHFYGAT